MTPVSACAGLSRQEGDGQGKGAFGAHGPPLVPGPPGGVLGEPGSGLGLIQRAQGRLDAARKTYQQALELAPVSDHRPVLPATVASVGMAEVAYQQGELDDALRHATEGVALARQLANTQWLATGLAIQAWIWQAQGHRPPPWQPSTRPSGSRRARA